MRYYILLIAPFLYSCLNRDVTLIREYIIESASLGDSTILDTIKIYGNDTIYAGNNSNLKNLWLTDNAIRYNWSSNSRMDFLYRKDVTISFDSTYSLSQRGIALEKYVVTVLNPDLLYVGFYSSKYGTVFWKSAEGIDKLRLIKIYYSTNEVDDLADIQGFIDSLRNSKYEFDYKNIEVDTNSELEDKIIIIDGY